MKTLAGIAGVSADDHEVQLAERLARSDRALLRSLVRARQRRSLTQQDVADRLGLTQPTIAAFERHDSDPKLSTLRRYAQVVGVMVAHDVTPEFSIAATPGWHPPCGQARNVGQALTLNRDT